MPSTFPSAVRFRMKFNHTDDNFQTKINEYAATLGFSKERLESLPAVYLLPSGVPNKDMPGIYKSADCFVLPSRGECWGRPHVEAMAMGVPVIATNWSGPQEYMT